MTKKELKARIEKWKPGNEIKVRVEESPSRPGGRWVILATSEEACFPAEREGYEWGFSAILCRSLTSGGAARRAAKILLWIKQIYPGPGVGSYGPPRDFGAESERMFEGKTDGKIAPFLPMGGSGEVGDTIKLAREILIHQPVPWGREEQKTLARWCLSLACIFNGETLKQLAQCKLKKENGDEDAAKPG